MTPEIAGQSFLQNRWVQLTAMVLSTVTLSNMQYGWTLFVNPMRNELRQMWISMITEEGASSSMPALNEIPIAIQPGTAAPAVDRGALRRELESKIEGEVRFDPVSRALYSTDASVYEIKPVGVVIPRNREDILRSLEVCRRHRCPVTMRGGGTSQCGQSIGTGLQIDTSKYYNRVLEVNAGERWVRVEPGIVLDELNSQLAPLGLRFAPDISTASRATIGGMIANNAAGARSVWWGRTIDHVEEMAVALADSSVVHFREVPRSKVPAGDTLEAACYRTVLGLASEHAEEIGRRYPKILRHVGGYNLDEFTDAAKPVNLAKIMVGSEGTLGIVLEAKLRLVPLPKAKAVMVVMFNDLLESLAAVPVILEHKPSAVEVMDKSILDYTRQNANARPHSQHVYRRRPGCHFVRGVLRGLERGAAAAAPGARRRSAEAKARLRVPGRNRPGIAGENLEPARELAGPLDGHEGRRQIDLLRGRHRRGA